MISKKIFLILTLLFSITFLKAEAEIEVTNQDGLTISFAATTAPDAWIGIYKKGATNDWENVFEWDWVDDGTVTFEVFLLRTGDYEARLFYNNSFVTEASVDFELIERPANNDGQRFFNKTTFAYQDSLTLNLIYQPNQEEDWVGVFKQGEEPIRANLKAWTYISNNTKEQELEIFDKNALSAGIYDVVYFTNNKYNSSLGTSATLTVEDQITYTPKNGKDVLRYSTLLDSPNNWIALFKRDKAPIKENILAWSYVRDGEVLNSIGHINEVYFSNIPTIGINNTFKLVLFKNDTYEIIAEDKTAGFD